MTTSTAGSLGSDTVEASSQTFVINLCSSTSPMALAHPSSPELKRYTFFVSRQREDGRERFRLHMGYFASQELAEQLLAAVRDVYPAAWAGPAPTQGVARRGRISPVQLAPAVAQAASAAAAGPSAQADKAGAAPPQSTAAPRPAPKPAPPALEQSMSEMRNVLAQLDEETTTASAPVDKPAPDLESKVEVSSPMPPMVPPIDPPRLQPVSQTKAAAAKPAAASPVAAKPAAASPVAAKPAAASPVAAKPVAASPVAAKPVAASPVAAGPVAAKPAAPSRVLTPAQTLEVLEVPPPLSSPMEGLENEPTVRVLTPEDTQTLRDIKLDKDNNAPPCFAVQLIWSVSPIDVTALPHLAIFDAYTLYNVEGNRQGRRWYGLRLGFFSDPNSATQVANYVRSDYRSVAVVPVANREKDRARGGSPVSPADTAVNPPLKATEQLTTNRETMAGFELVNDDRPVPQKRDLDAPQDAKAAVRAAVRARADKMLNPKPAPADTPARNGAAAAPASGGGRPTGKRVVVRKRPDTKVEGAPGTASVLESTLEILGASTLTLDEGNGKVLDSAAARRPASVRKKPANGKFSKLLSRLSGG
jgi:hypothetical protein